MAYQAKRKTVYTEEFELTEEDGTVFHTLHVSLDPDSVVARLSEKHVALVKALQNVQGVRQASSEEEKARGLEVLGCAVVDILEAVFGKEDTKVITDFYNNRYIEMCQEVVPFITGVVIPQVRKMARQNRKLVMAQYHRQKSPFFRAL